MIASIGETVDASQMITVDYDDRDLRTEPPTSTIYRMTDGKLASTTFFSAVERDVRDHLVRSMSLEVPANPSLKLYGRPGETADEFGDRCARAADELADADIADLRDKYESKVTRLRDQIAAAEDRVDVLEEEANSRRNSELLSTAGSLLGGLLGGRSRGGLLGKLGTAAGRRGRTSASRQRVDAAENKVGRLHDELAALEADLADDVTEIDERRNTVAGDIETLRVALEKSDVKVTELALAWMPVE